MAGGVVQWSVVLVGLPVCGVGIQSLPELLVALIQLAGEHLIPVDESLAEFGCRVAHRFFQMEQEALTQVARVFDSSSPTGQHRGCPRESQEKKITSFQAQHKSEALIAPAPQMPAASLRLLRTLCRRSLSSVSAAYSNLPCFSVCFFFCCCLFQIANHCQPSSNREKDKTSSGITRRFRRLLASPARPTESPGSF